MKYKKHRELFLKNKEMLREAYFKNNLTQTEIANSLKVPREEVRYFFIELFGKLPPNWKMQRAVQEKIKKKEFENIELFKRYMNMENATNTELMETLNKTIASAKQRITEIEKITKEKYIEMNRLNRPYYSEKSKLKRQIKDIEKLIKSIKEQDKEVKAK